MKQYRSKVDFLSALVYFVIILLVDGAAMVTSVEVLSSVAPYISMWVFVGTLTIPVLMLLFLLPLRYFLTADELAIHSGLLRWRIPVESILRVSRARGLRPGPALSLERLRVDYQKGNRTTSAHVSPVDRVGFMAELASADRGLVGVEGGGLVRQAGRILPLQHIAPLD